MEVLGGTVNQYNKQFSLRRKLFLGFLIAILLIPQTDTLYLSPAKIVASKNLFSIEQFELTNFYRKWLHLGWDVLLGNKPSHEEQLSLLDEYLILARQIKKEERRLEGLTNNPSTTMNSVIGKESYLSNAYLDELLKTERDLRARAESTIENELDTVLKSQGLKSWLGVVFPPVDITFDDTPKVLVISPRDQIKLQETVLLNPDINISERNRMENELLDNYNLSAFVDDLGGLATYPSLIPNTYLLQSILRITAHEWLHHYFFFNPLGQNMYNSNEMLVLNETTADIAGRELGDIAFIQMGGDIDFSASRFLPENQRDPILTLELRETRLTVENLLSQDKIIEAEQYMKEKWWHLVLAGYRLRKLNQAYFAFRGNYAESSASVSPLGDQLKELRSLVPNVGSFVDIMSGISSHREFLHVLENLKLKDSGVAN